MRNACWITIVFFLMGGLNLVGNMSKNKGMTLGNLLRREIYGWKVEKLVRYPEFRNASQAYESFIKVYVPDAAEQGLVQTEDQKWTVAKVVKDVIIIVFNAPSNSLAKKMCKSVERKIH